MPGDESWSPVGAAAARTVRGTSFAADVVLVPPVASTVGSPASSTDASVLAVVPAGRPHRVADLRALAALAASGTGPLILAEDGVDLDPPALLDLLDGPGDPTAALLIDPHNVEAPPQRLEALEQGVPARVGADGRLVESLGPGDYRVGSPNRLVAGVLRMSTADRARAAELWAMAAAGPAGPTDPAGRAALFDLALLILVRGGLSVPARSLGFYRWRRGAAAQSGVPGGPWRQRLRTASRGGDGLYSFAVVRRLSRRGTALALRFGWSPNLITVVSLLIGIGTAVLVGTGRPWAWVLAAVTLQLALVVDCMDGEVARFTRRFSALGAWLDGVGDRVKEYAVFAALALVATRNGETSGWLLALIAMALVTGRHLEDYAYTDQLAPRRVSRPDRSGLEVGPDARAAAGERVTLGAAPGTRARTVFWAKKVVHLPIAERYLLISLLLLTFHPTWVLIGTVVANGLALIWAVGGRVVREARRAVDPPASVGTVSVSSSKKGTREQGPLDHQLDLGPLARSALSARILQNRHAGPFLPGVVALVAVWLGAIACLCAGLGSPALLGALLAALIAGVTFAPPLRHRFGWLMPGLLWAAEAAVGAALLARGPLGGFIFVFLAVAAYRRYDVIYSVRLNGVPRSPRWTDGPGSDGRVVLIALLLGLAGLIVSLRADLTETAVLAPGLLVAAAVVAVPALIASVRQWRRT